MKIAVESDSLAQGYLLGALGGRFAANVVQFKTMELAVEAMKSGTVGAVLGSQTQIEAAAGTLPGNFELTPFKGVGLPVDAWDLGIAVKRDDAQLAAALEQAVQELMADGTLAQMFAREGVTWRPPKAAPGRWASVRIRKWVQPIHCLIVPNGCSTVQRRSRISSG